MNKKLIFFNIAFAFFLVGSASADSIYPIKPIKIFLGFPAGGSTDAALRVLADSVSKKLNQPVIVENRPGASGVLPSVVMQSVENDGYNLAIVLPTVFRVPYLNEYKWNPSNDLTYIIGLSAYSFGVLVRSDSNIKDWEDYVNTARYKNGGVTYGTPGVATIQHITMEQISQKLEVNFRHIPYKGTSETMQALLSGHIDSIADSSAWASLVKDGKLRLIVTWGEKRMESFPDVPTLKELGVPIFKKSYWGLVGPRGMDPKIVQKIHDAFKISLQDENFIKIIKNNEMSVEYMSSKKYREFALESIEKEKEYVKYISGEAMR